MQKAQQETCVVDANILIDLYRGDILEKLQRLPYQFVAPDIIVQELGHPDKLYVLQMGLIEVDSSYEDILKASDISQAVPGLSLEDAVAITYAQQNHLMLLSGDKLVRKQAEARTLTVHGVLWVLDQMVVHGIILPIEASQVLMSMLEKSARLPREECEKRITKWKSDVSP